MKIHIDRRIFMLNKNVGLKEMMCLGLASITFSIGAFLGGFNQAFGCAYSFQDDIKAFEENLENDLQKELVLRLKLTEEEMKMERARKKMEIEKHAMREEIRKLEIVEEMYKMATANKLQRLEIEQEKEKEINLIKEETKAYILEALEIVDEEIEMKKAWRRKLIEQDLESERELRLNGIELFKDVEASVARETKVLDEISAQNSDK